MILLQVFLSFLTNNKNLSIKFQIIFFSFNITSLSLFYSISCLKNSFLMRNIF